MTTKVNFWHTANLAFSDIEREEFNKWHMEIYEKAEKALCASNSLPDEERFSAIAKNNRSLMTIVCAIPWMEI